MGFVFSINFIKMLFRNTAYILSYVCLYMVKSVTTDSQSASPSWCLEPIWDQWPIFFLLEIFCRQLRVCYFVAPSLMRGLVCNLLLLLGLASSVPLGSHSLGTQDHILLSQFLRLPEPGGPGPRIYIPQEQGGPDFPPPPPGHWAPFPSPPTTRR
jgi:hypothetical protein